MGSKNSSEVLRIMEETKVIPLFYHSDLNTIKGIIEACYKGGAKIFEFTHRGPDAFENFKQLILWSEKYPELILGIGSIVEDSQAQKYIQAGANFIVSPILNEKIGEVCLSSNTAWIPGCATPTEIRQAELWGAKMIKIFPVSLLGGADFVKAIKAPMPWLKIMASGGVTIKKDDLENWKASGVSCLGFGSSLLIRSTNGSFDLEAIEKNVRKIMEYLVDS